ncbi:MAG TPA: YciI family protein, partial [Candidatus Sulfopaludibacter sp.]|nr:YciI family protein [Candidatus Sulfopaludibacter sp.]
MKEQLIVKFVCLGYIEPGKLENMSETERNAFLDGCFAYDDVLRKNGHFASGEALQGANTAATLRWKNG